MVTEHVQPVLVVSFEDPADVRRAYEDLRNRYRCDYVDGGILVVVSARDGLPPGIALRHDTRADAAYREVERAVSEELAELEAKGTVPTVPSRHLSRPSPNELRVYAEAAGFLLVEDPAGEATGKRLAALKVVGVLNAHLEEQERPEYRVTTSNTRRLYAALRESVPGLVVAPDSNGGRMYFSGVDWSPEAKEWRELPPFKAPYT